ncbi:MAG: hypothetical protein SFW67_17540 [Myxococcaceae bacterium]|nr:hypothetical protein [Myxococcaceae bacterium]
MHVAVVVSRLAFFIDVRAGGGRCWRVRVPHAAFWLDGALPPGDSFRVTYVPDDQFVLDVEPANRLACGNPTCTGRRVDAGRVHRCVPCAVFESDAEAAAAAARLAEVTT